MSLSCISTCDNFVPIKVEENDLSTGILEILKLVRPQWSIKDIKFKVFTDGITNKLVACSINKNTDLESIVLVRIYGNKTDLLIDRTAELRNINALNKEGLAPHIYGVFLNGLVYEYYPGVTLSMNSVVDGKIWPLVAKQMGKMHKVELGQEVSRDPIVWDKIEQFLSLVPEPFSDPEKQNCFVRTFGSLTRLRIEYEKLKSHLIETNSPIVFAHNDLLLGNVIHNLEEGTISFIDFEYAAYNYQAFDIANHFNEFVGISLDEIDYSKYPTKDFQSEWIKTYLREYNQEDPTDNDVDKVLIEVERMSLASNFLWGVWSLVQFEHSSIDFDFGRYAEIRLNRYFDTKNKVLKEYS